MTYNETIILKPEDQPAPMEVIGTHITVLAANTKTGGYEITLQEGGEGMGPPPHKHDWDESFYILRGKVLFTCKGESVLCSTGTLVHIPANTVHSFQYGAGGASMLEMTSAGGRATQMFESLSREIPPGPPDVEKVVSVLADNGVSVVL